MRAKRSKKYRKIMSSYQLHFSFREPYQVLLDSSFLRACHAFHMPLQKYLENTLHGQSRLFVTQCTLDKATKEWEKTKEKNGDRRKGGRPQWLPPPTEVPLRYCKHKNEKGEDVGVLDEARCLLDLLSGQVKGNEMSKNKQHYVLATAEAEEVERRKRGWVDVRERARLVPGVPIVYVKRSVMVLEELSMSSEAWMRKEERGKFKEGLMGPRGVKRSREDDDDPIVRELMGEVDNYVDKTRGMQKAKGPNPLSVPKKKVKGTQDDQETTQPTVNEDDPKPTRRKRGRRKAADLAEDNDNRASDGGVPVEREEVGL